MKTRKKTTARKSLLRFDNELRTLSDDFNALIARTSFFARNKQAIAQPKLSVA
jgi:hypothetical protein